MKPCAHCGDLLPSTSRRNKVYCSRLCSNAAYRAAGRGSSAEKQREYARTSRRRRRAALLEAIGPRRCVECGNELPEGARLRRQFCSRKCINTRSLRENRAERAEATRRRKARLRLATVIGVSARDWERLIRRYRGCCAYCGDPCKPTMDHVIPLARGGQHAIGNVLPACSTCNSSKRDVFLAEWRRGRTIARRAA